MASPILAAPELVEGQAVPDVTVNEMFRYSEQGARWFAFLDRDLSTPPGSPADGDTYLVASSATGAWSGHDGEIAFYMSTAWNFISPQAGFAGRVDDEGVLIAFDGTDWGQFGTPQVFLADQAEYDALTPEDGTLYYVPEAAS